MVLRFALFALAALLLTACASLYKFNVDVLEPADITIPPGIDSVVVVNRIEIPQHDKSSNFLTTTSKDKIHVRTVVSEKATKKLHDYLQNSPKFQYIKVVNDTSQTSKRKLNKQYLQTLVRSFNVKGAIILDTLFYNHFAKLKRRGSYIKAHTQVVYKSIWKFYNLQTGTKLDKLAISDEANWEGNFYTKNAALETMPGKLETATRTGEVIGRKYGVRIAPHWLNTERYFYAYHPKLIEAQRAAANDNWKKAAELWRPVAEQGNKIVSEYASFNMAVAAEMMGNPRIALEWAKKAREMYKGETTEKYIQTLEKRIEKQERLNKQLK